MTNTETSTTESSELEKLQKKPQLWKAGQSGNPNGRPKGSKNKLTLLREAVLESAESIVLGNFEDIVKATVELAKAGDPTALKIVWDRIIPAKRSIEDKVDTHDKLNIHINISGMEVLSVGGEKVPDKEKVSTNYVDGDFTEIKE